MIFITPMPPTISEITAMAAISNAKVWLVLVIVRRMSSPRLTQAPSTATLAARLRIEGFDLGLRHLEVGDGRLVVRAQ